MSFFNKKEEVIEVILTSYGKYKLSKGEWKPEFYAFFDEDILYDSRYAGYSEISGSTEARIQEETPSMRAQTIYSDLPKQIKKLDRAQRAAKVANRNTGKIYTNVVRASTNRAPYVLPLGNSTTISEKNLYAPAWEIKALKNEFTASMSFGSSSYEAVVQIPQLEIDIDYTTEIEKSPDAEVLAAGWENDPNDTEFNDMSDGEALPGTGTPRDMLLSTYFEDGTMIVVTDNYLVLEVNELNSAAAIDQFYAEVWEVEEDDSLQPRDNTGQSLTRMSFIRYPETVVNNILLDESELPPDYNMALIDDRYVEYFMDFQADQEIDTSTVCNTIATTVDAQRDWHTVLSCYQSADDQGSVLYESEDVDLLASLCEECED
tara:strand:- start:104 stop:1228 length:1125 start_codon:yes stop_codon:yes gene_type:complete